MADYLLIHGGSVSTDTWNSLVGREDYPPGGRLGGRVWDTVIPPLTARGHRVFAPTLEDEHDSHLVRHVEQARAVIDGKDLRGVVLVGHSYGGMVITGAAAADRGRIGRLVYLDAALPDPGQSLYDLLALGGLDPATVAGLEPVAPYMEKLRFDPRRIAALPKTYISCTESQFAFVTRLAREKIAAAGEGWTCRELPTTHVPMATMPERLAELLLEASE